MRARRYNERPDNGAWSGHHLLYWQLVFALLAGLMSAPLDLLGLWMMGALPPDTVPYAKFHLIRAILFAAITFSLWRWVLPRLRGLFALRVLTQVVLGILVYGNGLYLAFALWLRIVEPTSDVISIFAATPRIAPLLNVLGATLYMILGGLSLDSATSEQRRLSDSALSARLEALRNQINHHFLFNSLNAIAEAAAADESPRTERMILQLARVLRYSLGASRSRLALLREELAAVASYLELERARSGNKVAVRTEIAGDVGPLRVPPLLIQPLVENAVRHGLENGSRPGTITISAQSEGELLKIQVIDDGIGFEPDSPNPSESDHVGLSNLRSRLSALYGDKAWVSLSSRPEGGTTAEVRIPLTEWSDDDPDSSRAFLRRLFFGSAGSLLSLLVFVSLKAFGMDPDGVLGNSAVAEVLYVVIAGWVGEARLLDLAIVGFFFVGQIAQLTGAAESFVDHSPAFLILSCGTTAILAQAFGVEPFTSRWTGGSTFLPIADGASSRFRRHLDVTLGVTFIALGIIALNAGRLSVLAGCAGVTLMGLTLLPLPVVFESARAQLRRVRIRNLLHKNKEGGALPLPR